MYEGCDGFDGYEVPDVPLEEAPAVAPEDSSLMSELRAQYEAENANDGFAVDPYADIWDMLERGEDMRQNGPVAPVGPSPAQQLAEINGELDSSMLNNSLLPPDGQVANYDDQLGRVVYEPGS